MSRQKARRQRLPPETRRRRRALLRPLYRGNRLLLALCLMLSLSNVVLNLALSWSMQQLVDLAAGAGGRLTLGQLTALLGVFLAFLLLATGLSWLAAPAFYRRAMRQYKENAFARLTQKDMAAFQKESASLYLSALTSDASGVETGYLQALFGLPVNLLLFAGAFGLMLFYSVPLTIAAALLALLPVVASLAAGDRLAQREKAVSDRNERFLGQLRDLLDGFSLIKGFQAEQPAVRLFAQSDQMLEQSKYLRRRTQNALANLGSTAGFAAQFGVFLLGAWLAQQGRGVTAGVVVAFVQLMGLAVEPIALIPQLLAGRRAALALVDKLAAALAENAPQPGREIPAGPHRALTLENVGFAYTPGEPVLQGISFCFEAGKSYAVVGGSGSGKSTLLELLLGSHAGYTGSIRCDGYELREIRADALCRMISIIRQKVFLFNGTLRDNITMFGRFPPETLDQAVRQAGLGPLVRARGLEFACGEGGQNLSGGERQRVAIARSLLRRTPVLLADEATAALDAASAFAVTDSILSLEGVTRILVTHRLEEALLRRYDGILVLKDGRLAESGTFARLMEQKGYFYSLFTVAQ